MKITDIMALARPGRSRVRGGGADGHCGCVRLCAGQKDNDDLPATCAVRALLAGAGAAGGR